MNQHYNDTLGLPVVRCHAQVDELNYNHTKQSFWFTWKMLLSNEMQHIIEETSMRQLFY